MAVTAEDDRVCKPDDTAWSLFCALQRASVEVLGSNDHRRAALQQVRFAIEAAAPDRVFEHRLRDYNGHAPGFRQSDAAWGVDTLYRRGE